MNHESSRFHQREKQDTTEAQKSQQETGVVFETPEAALRADATMTEVPAAVKTRLAESVQQENPASRPRSWWRRLLG